MSVSNSELRKKTKLMPEVTDNLRLTAHDL